MAFRCCGGRVCFPNSPQLFLHPRRSFEQTDYTDLFHPPPPPPGPVAAAWVSPAREVWFHPAAEAQLQNASGN